MPSAPFAPRRPGRPLAAAFCLAALLVAPVARAADGPLAGSGVAMVPADAAFLTATLRLREQLELIVNSNAFAALKKLPAVARALDSLEEQKTAPGSPLSMLETFMQLPENEEARALLEDMLSTDTFLYGDPSCIAFLQLIMAVQRAQAAVGLEVGGEAAGDPLGMHRPGAAARIVPVQLAMDDAEMLAPEERQARAIVETLVANLDKIVVPDVVWGFKTSKVDVGMSQLKRLEVLAKLVTQANPDLTEALARREVAGGEVITFTLDGDKLPWRDLERSLGSMGDIEGIDDVMEKLRELDLVVAIGVIGDRVILSIGDSIDHLEKLALPDNDRKGLLTLPAFAPLLEHAAKKITGISYMSEELAIAVAPSAGDVEPMLSSITAAVAEQTNPATADDVKKWLDEAGEAYGKRLPQPGPWMAFSFLSEQGYEGYVWNWAKNQPLDDGSRLGLLDHAGGAPLAVLVSRLKSDPTWLDDVVSFVDTGLKLFRTYGLDAAEDDVRENFESFDKHIVPLGEKLVTILREKIVAALADGQVGLVLDGKTKSQRLYKDMPSSAEPLPVVEPAIVLPLADAKLFRDGLSDLFELSDELVDALRKMSPDAVPAGYRVPEPSKEKVEGGTVWSFAMPSVGVDGQIQPAIGVGEKAAVFSFVPAQAGRMLNANRLETGVSGAFEEPLATAAALDLAGIFSALEPWVVYAARYASVQQREGEVDPDEELDADDESDETKEVLQHVGVAFEVARCLRSAVAETKFKDGALVTHWQNVIRDLK